jgi:hypothetical protein
VPRWLFALVVVALVGGVAYAVGVPAPVVYLLRGIARHFLYSLGG